MIVTYEYEYKGKEVKEPANFETKEQAEKFLSLLRNSENYKNLREEKDNHKGENK